MKLFKMSTILATMEIQIKKWIFYTSQNDKYYQSNGHNAAENVGKKGHLSTRKN